MKPLFFATSLSIISVLFFGCRTAVQVVDMQPTSPNIKDNQTHYVFDNDTIRIAYHFWGDRGTFWFEIQNKLNVPIYIDWKRSNLVNNNIPNAYWDDNKQVSTVSLGKSYGAAVLGSNGVAVSAAVGGSVSNSIVTSKERISFLSPKAITYSPQFRIADQYYVLSKDAVRTDEANDAKPVKMTPVFTQRLAENTPIELTNFLTLSLTESFDKEIFVSNSFIASEVREMETSHFNGKPVGQDYNFGSLYEPPSASEKRFFLVVPKDYNHRTYWKLKN